ncbi:MAG TPA: 30S ribosomal protein S20 [Candidatus Saccharimonadales bacterium]|nr:30S ribosomal protein S20 [Candidatus Saccharimonadales bacterium]
MPIIKSAKKRVRTAEKAAIRNSKTKRSLKSAVKAFHRAITGGKKADVAKSHGEAQSALDKAAKKNVMHKNKVARKKSQLSKAAKAAAGVADKPAVKKEVAKAKAAPKAAVKKAAPAKKPAAKKAPAKKPAAKK